MKQALIDGRLNVSIIDSDIPTPQPGQILIRVVVSGTNPKDWKVPKFWSDGTPRNHGDDIAGFVEEVGQGVKNFRKGDRVGAFHEMGSLHGSYAEYAIAWETSTFHVDDKVSFEATATVPLAAMTAALGLYQRLNLPLPWNPTNERIPLIVYGGAAAVGSFVIKLAQLSNIHPIIAIAGRGIPYVETLLDKEKGDVIIDYRQGDETVREQIENAAAGPIHYAFDAVSNNVSYENLFNVLTAPAQLNHFLPPPESDKVPEGVRLHRTMVGTVHFPPKEGCSVGDREFGTAIYQFLGRGLGDGWFSGHPFEVRPGGLNAVEGALNDLEAGKASAVKYVLRIGETEGVNA